MWPPKFSDCIEACNTARRRCERLVTTALAQPDVNVVAATIAIARRLLADRDPYNSIARARFQVRLSTLRRLCTRLRGTRQGVRQTRRHRSLFPLWRSLSEMRSGMRQARQDEKTR